MGNCEFSTDEYLDTSESKEDAEQQPFTFCPTDVNDENFIKGWLMKKSKRIGSWRKRWTLLYHNSDENIFIVQTFKDKAAKTKPTETIHIDHNIEIQEDDTNDNQFIIYQKSVKRGFAFRAFSNQQCDRWIKVLKYHVNASIDAKPEDDDIKSETMEHNKQSYHDFELQTECHHDESMLKINVKHLKTNQIYTVELENQTKSKSNLSQYITSAKEQNLLRIYLKECNKLANMLKLSENVIELVLDAETKQQQIITLRPKRENPLESDTKTENTEEETYKNAILSTCDGAYGSIEGLADRSPFKQHMNNKDPIAQNTKKIMKEIRKDLANNIYLSYNNGSMFVRFDEANPRYLQAMLIGLQHTPYVNGCFLFDIYLCSGYPSCAPQVKHTTNGANLPKANNGPGGFSPNLHQSTGKVCLSLLGTWAGPGWKANESNVYQILATLLFMVFGAKHPYYMEPNYGGWEGTINDKTSHDPKVYEYNEELLYHTAKCTILDLLKKPYIGFEDIIKVHFKMKSKQIVEQMQEVMDNEHYSKAFKDKIKPIHEQIKIEIAKL